MIVISDASLIISLSAVGCLDLLQKLYGKVIIPKAVYQEIKIGLDKPGAEEIENYNWIFIQETSNAEFTGALKLDLGDGEAEAIVLAKELKAQLLLVDERKARKVASRFSINVIGTIGILVDAKNKGHIKKIKNILDSLISNLSFRISYMITFYNR